LRGHFLTSREKLLLFQLHGLAAVIDRTAASLGDDNFGAALGAAVSFTYLICHRETPLY
jgi:hypothetical protein